METKKILKQQNRGFDPRIIIASKVTKDVIHLKINGIPLGRYCECGCNQRIVGKMVTRRNNKNGKIQTYEQPPLKNQRFLNRVHKNRYYDKISRPSAHKSKNALDCRVRLNIENDGEQFRTLTVYMKKGSKLKFKIRPEYKELWDLLESISYYRKSISEKKILSRNILQVINI